MSRRHIEKAEVQIHSSQLRNKMEVTCHPHDSAALTSGKHSLSTHSIGGNVDSRAGLHLLEKNKTLAPTGIRI
jgi:hypothetical protein